MKYESLEKTTSCWVGQDKYRRYNMEESWKEAQSNPRTRPGWMYSRGTSINSCSSMYKVYNKCNSYEKGRLGCDELAVQCLFMPDLFITRVYSLFLLQTDISFSHLIVYFSAG